VKKINTIIVLLSLLILNCGCVYSLGFQDQNLPLGVRSVYIEPFVNDTHFVGPELDFTNHLVQEFKRSKVGRIVGPDQAEAVLKGRLISIQRIKRPPVAQSRNLNRPRAQGWANLPPGTRITTEYLLRVKVRLNFFHKKKQKVVWTQIFTDESIYPSSRLALKNINTALPNYNDSTEKRVINQLSEVMMQEAVGRLTESF